MMIKGSRILVLAAAACALLGYLPAAVAADSVPELRALAAEAGPLGPMIHLRADVELDTVHYSPQPGVWVVEMPDATWAEGLGSMAEPGLGVERAELAHVEEFGKQLARFTVWLTAPAQLKVTPKPDGADLEFSFVDRPAAPQAASPSTETPPPVESPAVEPVVTVPTAATASPVAPEESYVTAATNLLEVLPVRAGDGLSLELRGDGTLKGDCFRLPDPPRLVIDLPGVVSRVKQTLYSVGSPLVNRVRVAQHQVTPDPITRVVVDLNADVEHRFVSGANGATVLVGVDQPAKPVAAVETADASVSAAAVAPAAEPETQPLDVAAVESEELTSLAASSPAPVPVVVEPQVEARNPWVAEPSQLVERAPAAEVIPTQQKEESYTTTTVATQAAEYTGEPITLTLKDADIKDVLRTFSALTNLNVVVDPGVKGSVTVELRNVPWDQALDLILKINGLGYVLENNVLRVSTLQKLSQEKAEQARLNEQEEESQAVKTVMKPLAYAKASTLGQMLQSFLLSKRGSVQQDERTNTLIIRDTVDRVEGVLRMIEQLDEPTPQVVIEGRIVETTRTFAYRLGVSWGFSSVNDSAHGNDTGLVFPNAITTEGNVNLPRVGNGTLAFTFADILNTFNLDFALQAAEENNLVRIVSAPRVTTQNMKKAMIQSGLQIPVQTIANNTVTVTYIDATLMLEVTPQITAEGTVNLDMNIRKRLPLEQFLVAGGTNAPMQVREVRNELMVRDGGTAMIGGIYQLNDQQGESSVPLLSKIPIVGNLFKSRGNSKNHDELLIFITPRIVKY